MVVEMRKIRLGFTEVMMAINKIKERDNKARIRKEQTIKKVEDLKENIIEITEVQLENEKKNS